MWYVLTMQCYSVTERNQVLIYTIKCVTLKMVYEVKEARYQSHILYDSFYIQEYPEEANPQGQKVD